VAKRDPESPLVDRFSRASKMPSQANIRPGLRGRRLDLTPRLEVHRAIDKIARNQSILSDSQHALSFVILRKESEMSAPPPTDGRRDAWPEQALPAFVTRVLPVVTRVRLHHREDVFLTAISRSSSTRSASPRRRAAPACVRILNTGLHGSWKML